MSAKGINTHDKYKLNHRVNEDNKVERRCSKCLEWKIENTDNFYLKNKSYPERGFSPECKICSRERSKKNGNDNKERRSAYFKEWHKNNKERMNEKCRQWMITNREYAKSYIEAWRKSEEGREWCNNYGNDRRQHKTHGISKKEWESCKLYFDEECAYCGLPSEKHIIKRKGRCIVMNFHKDHVDDNGANDLRNAVPSCQSCNSSKHESGLDEWYKKQKFFNEDKYNKILWWISEGYICYIEDKPPYRIIRKQNKDKKTFHWELWSVDEQRNMIECIKVGNKKKDLV